MKYDVHRGRWQLFCETVLCLLTTNEKLKYVFSIRKTLSNSPYASGVSSPTMALSDHHLLLMLMSSDNLLPRSGTNILTHISLQEMGRSDEISFPR